MKLLLLALALVTTPAFAGASLNPAVKAQLSALVKQCAVKSPMGHTVISNDCAEIFTIEPKIDFIGHSGQSFGGWISVGNDWYSYQLTYAAGLDRDENSVKFYDVNGRYIGGMENVYDSANNEIEALASLLR